jgi:hypothetical protein
MITSTKGSPNNIIHPTRARNTGFGKENFGRVMMSVGWTDDDWDISLRQNGNTSARQ